MLYVFEIDGKVRVGNLDPDNNENDFEKVLSESFEAVLDNSTRLPASTQANIVRNVLSNGLPGRSVTLK